MMQAGRGNEKVTIVSAEPLSAGQISSIQKGVVKMSGVKGEVEVETKVDPSILGGLQVMIGDKFLDLSARSRIAELSQALGSTN